MAVARGHHLHLAPACSSWLPGTLDISGKLLFLSFENWQGHKTMALASYS